MENPKEFTEKLLDLINEFSICRIQAQNYISIHLEFTIWRWNWEKLPFTIASDRIKFFETNSSKEV